VQPQIFVVSDPPHAQRDMDAVAAVLGLGVDDTRLKVDFPAPEVLMVSDPAHANDFANSLRDAGLNVQVFDGAALAEIPWPAPVSSFEFRDGGLAARVGSEDIVLPCDLPVVAVRSQPPLDFVLGTPAEVDTKADGVSIAESIQWMGLLELYYNVYGEIGRLTIVRDVTDFGGLEGPRGTPDTVDPDSSSGITDPLSAMLTACEHCFAHIEVDARLSGVLPRQRFAMGDTGFDPDMRKNFSYGTLLLRQALNSVSPDLGDLTQFELGSRLAYVLCRSRDG